MTKRTQKALSMLLTAAMTLTVAVTSLFAITACAAEPKEIDKVIIDFRSEAEFTASGAAAYVHKPTDAEPDPLTGGKVSWSDTEKALRIEYSASTKQKPYRFMFNVAKAAKGRLAPEYKFAAIVFKVKGADGYSVKLSNSPNQGKALEMTGLKSSENYKILKGDISVIDGNGKSLQSRWLGGNINTLAFDIKVQTADVYVKEVAFFKTEADLDAYYASVDLEKSPKEYMSDEQKKAHEADAGAASATTPAAPSTPTVTETPKVPLEEQPDPVIWKFNGLVGQSDTKWKFTDHADNTEGEYKFVTINGEQVLQLLHSPYGGFAAYRFMPASTEAGHITKDHQYIRITYMTPDPISSQITVLSNKNHSDKAILVENTAVSKGEWVRSNAVYYGAGEMPTRFSNRIHCTFGYTSTSDSAVIYIKEIGFFASPEQAYAYYGDDESFADSGYVEMYFNGPDATGGVNKGQDWGESTVNAKTGDLDITYVEKSNHGVNYMAKIKFTKNGMITPNHKYVRILYSADHPEGVTTAEFRMKNDKTGAVMTIDPAMADTDGKYVLSNTFEIVPDSLHRFAGSGDYTNANHNSLHIVNTKPGGVYSIKGVYFFASKVAADSFTPPIGGSHKIEINGNDISKYSIVISKDQPFKIVTAANNLNDRIEQLTGIKLPIVTDDTAVSPYEILIGQSSRPESTEILGSYNDGENAFKRYAVALVGDKPVITSALPYGSEEAVDLVIGTFLYKGIAAIPETVVIDSTFKFDGVSSTLGRYTNWAEVSNVEDPTVFTEDFESDDGYFTESNNAQIFNIENGVMKATVTDEAITYVHVYEKNVTASAKLSYTGTVADSDFGLMLRYTGKDAFVKAGYDFKTGDWYVSSREGADFYAQLLGSHKAELAPDTVYNVEFTADGDALTLTVNGEKIITASGAAQVTPGRIGVYAKNITVTVDDYNAVLLSGQGTVWQNASHTLLPDDEYREGGSVFEMSDGSLNYTYHGGVNFKSLDGGKSWERTDAWTTYTGYVNMLRLVDGTFMKVSSDSGWMYSYTSTDEGKTWTRGGSITRTPFRGDTKIAASAVNMNDKLNQSSNGTIYYCQNYESTSSDFEGRKVFCEFFFSSDNGATWWKSNTDSWTIEGNEEEKWFGECKILDCADGTIRMYNSWNKYGCIVYSDSTDGGKTFGPIQRMDQFQCARSSMQFWRDPYGETDTTYYMIWVNTQENPQQDAMPRSTISLAKSTDGKTWTVLGDVWRWQSNYRYGNSGAVLNHVVDPFVKTTKDYVIVGTGLSEHTAMAGDNSYHGAQRQHIWSIAKATLPTGN